MSEFLKDSFPNSKKVKPQSKKLPDTGRSIGDVLGDTAISVGHGVVDVGEAAVGLADIPTLGAAGKFAEDKLGVDFQKTHEILDSGLSDSQVKANQAVSDAEGFTETIGASLANPSTIGQSIVRSGGLIGAGRAVAGKLTAKLGGAVAGAVGEGLGMTGSAAEGIRQQTDTGDLTLGQTGAALGTGVVGGFFGAMGGKLAKKLGVDDIDVVGQAGDVVQEASSKSFARKMVQAGISEGIFEEMPQSVQETMFSNVALDKPLFEGVPESAAQGLVTGSVMGAGFQGVNTALKPKSSLTKAKDKLKEGATEAVDAVNNPEKEGDKPKPKGKTQQSAEDLTSAFGNPNGTTSGLPAKLGDNQNGSLSTVVKDPVEPKSEKAPALEGELLEADREQGKPVSALLEDANSTVATQGQSVPKIEESGDIFAGEDKPTKEKIKDIKSLSVDKRKALTDQRVAELTELSNVMEGESKIKDSLLKDIQALQSGKNNTRSNIALLPLLDKVQGDSKTAQVFKKELSPEQYTNLVDSLGNQGIFNQGELDVFGGRTNAGTSIDDSGLSQQRGQSDNTITNDNNTSKDDVANGRQEESKTAQTDKGEKAGAKTGAKTGFVEETKGFKIGDTFEDGKKITAIRDVPEGVFVSTSDSSIPDNRKGFRKPKGKGNSTSKTDIDVAANEVDESTTNSLNEAIDNEINKLNENSDVESFINNINETIKGIRPNSKDLTSDTNKNFDKEFKEIFNKKINKKLNKKLKEKFNEKLKKKSEGNDTDDVIQPLHEPSNIIYKTKGEGNDTDTDKNTGEKENSSNDDNAITNQSGIPTEQSGSSNTTTESNSKKKLQSPNDGNVKPDSGRGEGLGLSEDGGLGGQRANESSESNVGQQSSQDRVLQEPNESVNHSLESAKNISLTPAKRRDVNNSVTEILKKDVNEITEADKQILTSYTGSGGLSAKDSVGKGANIFNQHFTDYTTIKEIYSALDKAGINTTGKVLEPSAGVGNFIGLNPNAKWDAVEIDPISADIMKILYPEVNVVNDTFETFIGINYDLVISNVPFASTSALTRQHVDTIKPQFKAIHNFFFAHSIDKLKDGGVMAFMTSTGTMDGTTEARKLRESLVKKADIIGAFRLPEGTQKANASTDVMIDLIVMQKRPEGVESKVQADNDAFVKVGNTLGYKMNQYLIDNPTHVLGELKVGSDKTKLGREGLIVTGEANYSAIKLNKQDYSIKKNEPIKDGFKNSKEAADNNEFFSEKTKPFYKDGVLFDNVVTFTDQEGSGLIGRKLTGENQDKMDLLSLIQDTLDPKLVEDYKAKHGVPPSADKKLKAWAKRNLATPILNEYAALFDKNFKPSEIFSDQVRFKDSGRLEIDDDSPLADKLEFNEDDKGVLGFDARKNLTDQEVQDSDYAVLANGDRQNPRLYYAGNIYKKIEDAEKVKDKGTRNLQLKKLNDILPAKTKIKKISIKGNESWLPKEAIEAIGLTTFKDGTKILGGKALTNDVQLEIFNRWVRGEKIISSDAVLSAEQNIQNYKEAILTLNNEIKPAIKQAIIDNGLEGVVEDAYNRSKNFYADPVFDGSSLKNLPKTFRGKEFKLMQHQSEGAERAIYNRKGVLAFAPGLGKTPTAIIVANQLLQKGVMKKPLFVVPANTIGQWEETTNELYPNAKVFQFPKFNKGSKKGQGKEWKDLTAVEKEGMLNDLTNNRYDYTFIGANLAQKFTIPNKKYEQYVDELVKSIAGLSNKSEHEMTKKELKTHESRLAKLAALKTTMMQNHEAEAGAGFDMEKLGFDAIFADEVQAYKNVGMLADDAKGGLGASVVLKAKFPKDDDGKELKDEDPISVNLDSSRSYDFRFKTRYIADNNNGNNVFLLTGTPTPNKPLELMTLMQHMDVNILKEYGINDVGDFVNEFFDVQAVEEANLSGKTSMKPQLTSIKNIEALKNIISRYVDYRSVESAKDLKRPQEVEITHTILRSDDTVTILEDIQGRLLEAIEDSKKMRQGEKVEGIEQVIIMYNAGRDTSVDLRLYSPSEKSKLVDVGQTFEKETDPKKSKFAKTVQLVSDKAIENSDAGQLVFVDRINFPKGSGIEITTHEDLRNDILEKSGLDPSQVVIMNGSQHVNPKTGLVIKSAANNSRKAEIMKAYNAGEIKVLIGNTSQMGVGVDLQVHTTDIYQLDIPYRPDEIEQRINRGVRQGNLNDSVNVHKFIQPMSFDEMSYRLIANKQGFNDVFWKGQNDSEVDVQAESAPDAFDAAIELEENPVKKSILRIQRELEKSNNIDKTLKNQISSTAFKIKDVMFDIQTLERVTEGLKDREVPAYEGLKGKAKTDAIKAFKKRMVEQTKTNQGKLEKLKAKKDKLFAARSNFNQELKNHNEKIKSIRDRFVTNGKVDSAKVQSEKDLFDNDGTTTEGNFTPDELTANLPKYALDMAKNGRLRIVKSSSDIGNGEFTKNSTMRGLYRSDQDVIYLVADNLNADNLMGTLNHEIYHRASLSDPKLKRKLTNLKKKARIMFNKAADGIGDADTIRAYERASRSRSNKVHQLEEFQAYLVSEFNNNNLDSNTLKNWVKNLVSSIKASLIRAGVVSGDLSGRDLNSIAVRFGTSIKSKAPVDKSAQVRRATDEKRSNSTLRNIIDKLTGKAKTEALAEARAENIKLKAENSKLKQELYSSDITPLQNRRAWNAEPKKKYIVSMDADSLKWVNDNMSHDAGNELLRLVGQAIKDSGMTGFHVSGDEFMATHDDLSLLKLQLRDATEQLENIEIKHTTPSGEVIIHRRAGLSFGIGESNQAAEDNLHKHKADREVQGLRMDRDVVGRNKEMLQAIIDSGRTPTFKERQKFNTDPPKVERVEAGSPDLFDDDGTTRPTNRGQGKHEEGFEGLDQSTRDTISKIGGDKKGKIEKAKDQIAKGRILWKRKLRQGAVDQFDSFKNILGDKTAWMMARMANGVGGTIETMIQSGRPMMDTKGSGAIDVDVNEKSVSQILEPLGNELDRFLMWVAGNRAEGLKVDGKENLFSDEDIANLKALDQNDNGTDWAERQEVYAAVLKDYEAMNDAVVQIGVDTGLISAEDAAIWKKQGFYIPFYRLSDEDSNKHGVNSVSGLVRQNAYKKLKGADMQLNDLLGNTLMNWHHIIGASLKNQAAAKALDTASKGDNPIATRTTESLKGKDAVFVRENGKEVWYDIAKNDEGALVLDSLTAMNFNGLNTASMKAMRTFKRWLTLGVTASPEFKVANLIRDTLQAAAVAGISPNVAKNLKQGFKATEKGSVNLARAGAGGGIFGDSGYVHGNDPDSIKRLLEKSVRRSNILTSDNLIGDMWDKYQDLGARAENVNRMANFEQDLANGKSLLEANFNARDHLDFQSTGSYVGVRALIQVIPFLNARIQGLDKLGRAGMDKDQQKQMAMVTGFYALASVALYLGMKDDEDYQAAEQWERDTYHLFKIPGTDVMFRLPRPFELGVMGTMAERAVEQLVDDKVHGDLFAERLTHAIVHTFSMNPVPQAFKPAIEIWANKNSFTDRAIESQSMRNLSPTERKKAWTSQTAIGLSKVADTMLWDDVVLSPIQIDHLIKGYFGWVGGTVVGGVDLLARPLTGQPEKPDKRIEDYPVLGRFFRQGEARNSRFITEFYERQREISQHYADVKNYKAEKEWGKYKEALSEYKDDLKDRKRFNRISKKLSALTKRIKLIHNSNQSGSIKRMKIDILNRKRVNLAKQTLGI